MGAAPYRAWGEALYSFRTGRPAFEQVYGEPYFDYLAAHPEAGDVFDRAMAGGAQARVTALRGYDWSGVSTVADIGGGTGSLLTSLLTEHQTLRGVSFDLPHVAAKAADSFAAAGLAGRSEALGGDFFTDALPRADAYVLSSILHDWDDEHGLAILRNCRRSLPDHGRLLLLEHVVPPGSAPSWSKHLDLHMLILLGGKERTEAEWRLLLGETRFRLVRVEPGAGTDLLEAVPVG
jgi:SAM-dependent methyltransferase